ncbi:MAG: hypothetical protein R3330_18105, partial [Saprospiraceae bacterium]|nr:hypothetical protein [Saprospiraceae bacterium]
MKKLYSTAVALFIGAVVFGQFNPGMYEMRLLGGPTMTEMQIRSIGGPLPSLNGNCFVADDNTDMTWSVVYDPAIVSSVAVATDLPCNFGAVPGGYFQGNAGPPVVISPTEHIQGFNIVASPIKFPEDWIADWMSICTLNVTLVVPPSQQSSSSSNPVVSIVPFGAYGAFADPNFGLNLTDYTPNVVAALPLDLLVFHADRKGDRSALLNWSTVNEINTSHFEIERSVDLENWELIGSVEAAGESTEV